MSGFIEDPDDDGTVFAHDPRYLPSPAPAGGGAPTERVVRHPNGHLMVERTPPWVPSRAETDAALASVAKAWPVLAQHAPHIDGEFDLALTDLRRMIDALRAASPGPTGTAREPSEDAVRARVWEEIADKAIAELAALRAAATGAAPDAREPSERLWQHGETGRTVWSVESPGPRYAAAGAAPASPAVREAAVNRAARALYESEPIQLFPWDSFEWSEQERYRDRVRIVAAALAAEGAVQTQQGGEDEPTDPGSRTGWHRRVQRDDGTE